MLPLNSLEKCLTLLLLWMTKSFSWIYKCIKSINATKEFDKNTLTNCEKTWVIEKVIAKTRNLACIFPILFSTNFANSPKYENWYENWYISFPSCRHNNLAVKEPLNIVLLNKCSRNISSNNTSAGNHFSEGLRIKIPKNYNRDFFLGIFK